jgi:hypothetical protein
VGSSPTALIQSPQLLSHPKASRLKIALRPDVSQ